MSTPSYRALRVWQRNHDVFLKLWRSEVPGFFAEPLVILLAMGVGLGAYVALSDNIDYIEFIAPGIVAAYAMFSASSECTYGSFVRMKFQRTFDAIITTPLSMEDVVAGEILSGATRSLMTAIAVLIVVSAFGLVHSPWALLVLPLALLTGLMFASIALFFTSVAPSIYSFNYYFTLFITPMFFFSGVFFPLDSFPEFSLDIALDLGDRPDQSAGERRPRLRRVVEPEHHLRPHRRFLPPGARHDETPPAEMNCLHNTNRGATRRVAPTPHVIASAAKQSLWYVWASAPTMCLDSRFRNNDSSHCILQFSTAGAALC